MHFHRWLRYFSGRGHEMYFISYLPVDDGHIERIEDAGANYLGAITTFHLKRFWVTLRNLRWLKRVLKDRGIQALHCHFLGANAWYGALSDFHPLIVSVMGGDVCGKDWKPGNDPRERWLTPLALRRADLITSWSNQLMRVARRHCQAGKTIEVVHGGVDLNRFNPGDRPRYLLKRWNLPENARVAFSPRLMRPLYNLDKIAIAAGEVCKKDPHAYFLFAYLNEVKDESYETRVHDLIRESGASDRVRFVGPIHHDEMVDHYRLADVTVSIPETDGTPMTVLESMACGTPVVVSDISDYDPHYIEPGETVLSVKPQDTAGLAVAILRLLEDSDLAGRLATEAGNRVRMAGSYEAQMSRMERLYLSLANDGRSV
jgi:glycosyltransferase involved in cell wall biosynthesis